MRRKQDKTAPVRPCSPEQLGTSDATVHCSAHAHLFCCPISSHVERFSLARETGYMPRASSEIYFHLDPVPYLRVIISVHPSLPSCVCPATHAVTESQGWRGSLCGQREELGWRVGTAAGRDSALNASSYQSLNLSPEEKDA